VISSDPRDPNVEGPAGLNGLAVDEEEDSRVEPAVLVVENGRQALPVDPDQLLQDGADGHRGRDGKSLFPAAHALPEIAHVGQPDGDPAVPQPPSSNHDGRGDRLHRRVDPHAESDEAQSEPRCESQPEGGDGNGIPSSRRSKADEREDERHQRSRSNDPAQERVSIGPAKKSLQAVALAGHLAVRRQMPGVWPPAAAPGAPQEWRAVPASPADRSAPRGT